LFLEAIEGSVYLNVLIKMVEALGYFQENANIAMLLREVDQI
jgi:hypothetical protein